MDYYEELAAMPNTILKRIDEMAEELRARITAPDYRSDMHGLLGGQVFYLLFSGIEDEERVTPANAAEWVTLRDEKNSDFERLLKDHCEDRLDVGMYEDPRHGMAAAVSAAIADIVAFRAIALNDGYDAPVKVAREGETPTDRIYNLPAPD